MERYLHRIVTHDKKWIYYDNPKQKKSWGKLGHASTSTAKPNIHGLKKIEAKPQNADFFRRGIRMLL